MDGLQVDEFQVAEAVAAARGSNSRDREQWQAAVIKA